jgi:hypothetical protein
VKNVLLYYVRLPGLSRSPRRAAIRATPPVSLGDAGSRAQNDVFAAVLAGRDVRAQFGGMAPFEHGRAALGPRRFDVTLRDRTRSQGGTHNPVVLVGSGVAGCGRRGRSRSGILC